MHEIKIHFLLFWKPVGDIKKYVHGRQWSIVIKKIRFAVSRVWFKSWLFCVSLASYFISLWFSFFVCKKGIISLVMITRDHVHKAIAELLHRRSLWSRCFSLLQKWIRYQAESNRGCKVLGSYEEGLLVAEGFQSIFDWAVKDGKVWTLDVEGKRWKVPHNGKLRVHRGSWIGRNSVFACAMGWVKRNVEIRLKLWSVFILLARTTTGCLHRERKQWQFYSRKIWTGNRD